MEEGRERKLVGKKWKIYVERKKKHESIDPQFCFFLNSPPIHFPFISLNLSSAGSHGQIFLNILVYFQEKCRVTLPWFMKLGRVHCTSWGKARVYILDWASDHWGFAQFIYLFVFYWIDLVLLLTRSGYLSSLISFYFWGLSQCFDKIFHWSESLVLRLMKEDKQLDILKLLHRWIVNSFWFFKIGKLQATKWATSNVKRLLPIIHFMTGPEVSYVVV